MTNFPEEIRVRVLNKKDHKPISNIMIHIILFATRKNNYNIFTELSDINGYIYITKNWLKKEIDLEMKGAIMDYASALEECKPYIEIRVLAQKDIEIAIESLKNWIETIEELKTELNNLILSENHKYKPMCLTIPIDQTKPVQNVDIYVEST